jgi:hypothetical protein
MRPTLFRRFFGNYKATRENKLYVNLSKEDFEYFYKVFPEFGLGSCIATALMLVLLKELKDANIKDYDDRQRNPKFASFDTIITDVIGYKQTPETNAEPNEGRAKRPPRKEV